MERDNRSEFDGFEEVASVVTRAEVAPDSAIRAAHIRAASAAAARASTSTHLGHSPWIDWLGRAAAVLLATLLGVVGLATAGALPDSAQNAVAGLAERIGVSLPTVPSSQSGVPVTTTEPVGRSVGDDSTRIPPTTTGDVDPPGSSFLDPDVAVQCDAEAIHTSGDDSVGDHLAAEEDCEEDDHTRPNGDGDDEEHSDEVASEKDSDDEAEDHSEDDGREDDEGEEAD